jgi:hypothetical protein
LRLAGTDFCENPRVMLVPLHFRPIVIASRTNDLVHRIIKILSKAGTVGSLQECLPRHSLNCIARILLGEEASSGKNILSVSGF